ncbi:MAG: TonB-dependent receptor [Bacteroidetes bacterium]|nr:TonB-dependent receptor [Bacteroidota bacterium]
MKFFFVKTTLLFVILSFSSLAQKSEDSTKLINEILVEGKYKDLDRLPILDGTRINSGKKNEVINLLQSSADLSINNYRQILAKVPGVSIWENDGSGIQTSISTRGLSPNRSWEFNVRQNGCDISSEAFGYPEAYFTPPTEALEKIEIIRGSASLQYGTQFGGLLNYVTKKNLTNKTFSFETQQTLGSYGLFNAYNAISGKIKKFSYFGYLHHRSADGWRENSQYRTNTGYLSLTYDFTSKFSISLEYTNMYYLSQQSGGLTDSMFQADPQQSVRSRNWFSSPWNSSAMHIKYDFNENTKLTVDIFNTLASRNSIGFMKDITNVDSLNGLFYNTRQIDRDWYNNLGVEARILKQYNLFGQKSAISIGTRIYKGNTRRKQGGIGSVNSDFDLTIVQQQNSQYGNFDYKKELSFETKNAAFFAENLFQLTDKLAITPGFRFEYIENRVLGTIDKPVIGIPLTVSNSVRNVLLTGVGGEYATTKTTNIYANFSQAFRPVTFSELTPSATTDSIDQELKDISGYNIDFGFRGSFLEAITFDIGVFYLFYNNRVGTISLDGKNLKTNIGASISQGIESFIEFDIFKLAALDKKFGNLKLFSSVSFIDAKYSRWDDPDAINDETKNFSGNYVENAPRNVNRFGFTYKYSRFSLTYQFNQVGSVFTDALNTENPNSKATIGKLDGYSLMDLSTTYLINGKYNVKAGINNLTNEKYATRRSGGYPGPGILPGNGRTFFFSIGVKF